MSDDTASTNVGGKTNDKYSKNMEEGSYVCNSVLCEVTEDRALSIFVDRRLAAQKQVVSGDGIRENGDMPIKVVTVSLQELNKLKATLKAKQLKQEAAMKDEKEIAQE